MQRTLRKRIASFLVLVAAILIILMETSVIPGKIASLVMGIAFLFFALVIAACEYWIRRRGVDD